MKELESVILKEATLLSNMRHELAEHLTNAIHQELKELYMEKTKFEVRIMKREGNVEESPCGRCAGKTYGGWLRSCGILYFNEPRRATKTTFKGCIWRRVISYHFSFKSIFSKHQGLHLLFLMKWIRGVSGRVAQAIAEKIYRVSVNSQVLCITHLPQVASMADSHLFIRKQVANDRTITSVTVLTMEDKVTEISSNDFWCGNHRFNDRACERITYASASF